MLVMGSDVETHPDEARSDTITAATIMESASP
jgi:hypothetical protein